MPHAVYTTSKSFFSHLKGQSAQVGDKQLYTSQTLLKVLFPVSGKYFSLSSCGRKLALRGGNRWEGGRKNESNYFSKPLP